jgi:hypothetical protein
LIKLLATTCGFVLVRELNFVLCKTTCRSGKSLLQAWFQRKNTATAAHSQCYAIAGIYSCNKYRKMAQLFYAGVLMEDSGEELTEEENTPVPIVEHACSQQTVFAEPAAAVAKGVVAPLCAVAPGALPISGLGSHPPHACPSRVVEQPSIESYAAVTKKPDRVDSFGMFAQLQVRPREFLAWVTPTDAQRENMLRVIGHSGTHHATERSWDRIPLGPVALSSCLDKEHKVMLTERVIVVVKKAGHVSLDREARRVISWQEQRCTRDSGIPEGSCSASTASMIEDYLSKARIVEPKRKGKVGVRHAKGEDEDVGGSSDEGERTVTKAFKKAFLAALHGGTAQVFRVQSLQAVTMVGTLVFNDDGSSLITVLPNAGECHQHMKVSLQLERLRRWGADVHQSSDVPAVVPRKRIKRTSKVLWQIEGMSGNAGSPGFLLPTPSA